MRRRLEAWLVNGLLAAGAVACAAPLLWMLSVSLMPAGMEQQLTPQELADLIAFLKACK